MKAAKKRARRLPQILEEMEDEPIRRDWLLLTPNQRLMRAWQMRKRLKNLQAAHDARSLPQL